MKEINGAGYDPRVEDVPGNFYEEDTIDAVESADEIKKYNRYGLIDRSSDYAVVVLGFLILGIIVAMISYDPSALLKRYLY